MDNNQQLIQNKPVYNIRELYDKYASMLLGYIYHIVKDHALAEQYLIDTFKEIPQHLHEINEAGSNAWLQLQKLAGKKVKGFLENLKEGEKQGLAVIGSYLARNKFLAMMTPEQQIVFCNVYYHHQTTANLSAELKITEEAVRKLLKEAFSIMRSAA